MSYDETKFEKIRQFLCTDMVDFADLCYFTVVKLLIIMCDVLLCVFIYVQVEVS